MYGNQYEEFVPLLHAVVLCLPCDLSCLVCLLLLQEPIKDGHAASKAILALEGVVDHGLFLDMVSVCIIAGANGVEVQERK